ncbi:hypothetical protein ES703_95933 [subsurface metagenome]
MLLVYGWKFQRIRRNVVGTEGPINHTAVSQIKIRSPLAVLVDVSVYRLHEPGHVCCYLIEKLIFRSWLICVSPRIEDNLGIVMVADYGLKIPFRKEISDDLCFRFGKSRRASINIGRRKRA